MKVAGLILGYLALLFPSLIIALDKWMDIADPPTVEVPYSFWTSACGQFVWFGFAFAAPALVLVVFKLAMRRIWKLL
jgi:hypothetical protein